MNKIKLLYDIARTMKDRERLAGILQVKVRRDQEEVFTLRNEFERSDAGKARHTVSAKLDLDGHHVTRESTTEFEGAGCCGHGPGLLRRILHGREGADRCCGIKGFFGRLAFALGLLNSIEATEQENGTARLSLSVDDLPEEMKGALLEGMRQKAAHCCHHGFLAECQVETVRGRIEVEIDTERKIERITLELEGSTRDAESELHAVAASGDVQFAW